MTEFQKQLKHMIDTNPEFDDVRDDIYKFRRKRKIKEIITVLLFIGWVINVVTLVIFANDISTNYMILRAASLFVWYIGGAIGLGEGVLLFFALLSSF